MIKKRTPIPEREQERLTTLYACNIMDTDAETPFDNITIRAKGLFNVPIAVISLIDHDRQWFKSKYGLHVQQTSREDAFCSYTIMSEEVMVVLDAKKDSRFCQNPLVTGYPHIRFYAAAPIIIPDGLILGTMCIIDTVARDIFSQKEQGMLTELAASVSQLIQEKITEP